MARTTMLSVDDDEQRHAMVSIRMRRALGGLSLIAGCCAMVSAGCARPRDPTQNAPADGVGGVELALRLSTAVTIARVSYEISGNGIMPIRGDIPVSDSSASASLFVSGIAPAANYLVSMSATTTDGQISCVGSGTFDVTVGMTASVSILIQCRPGDQGGGAVVVGTLNNCPRLTAVSASRLAAPVGGSMDLQASATDEDAGDMLSFLWTAPSGALSTRAAADTTFTCLGVGVSVLTVAVSDGACGDSVMLPLTCVSPACGNNVVDPGEQCEPPGRGTCGATCQRLGSCGDGVVGDGEQCDPPDGVSCDSSCRTISVAGGLAPGSLPARN